MTLAEQAVDLFLGLVQEIGAARLDHDSPDGIRKLRADQLALSSTQWYEDHIVLILALGGLSLAVQNPYYRERDLLDPNHVADRVGRPEQIVSHRLPHKT